VDEDDYRWLRDVKCAILRNCLTYTVRKLGALIGKLVEWKRGGGKNESEMRLHNVDE